MDIIDVLRDEGVRHPRGIVATGLASVIQPVLVIPFGVTVAILIGRPFLALLGLIVSMLLLVLGVNVAESVLEREIRHS